MALIKGIELETGVVCEYWKIISVQLLVKEKKLAIGLNLFKDKAARQADKASAKYACYEYSTDLVAGILDGKVDIMKASYKLLKDSEFSDAVDD